MEMKDKGSKDRIDRTGFFFNYFLKFFLADRKFEVCAGNWASFVRIEAAECGLRADCGALSAP